MFKYFVIILANPKNLFEWVSHPRPISELPIAQFDAKFDGCSIAIGFRSLKSAYKWHNETRYKSAFELQETYRYHNIL